jgi:hypothetical protein
MEGEPSTAKCNPSAVCTVHNSECGEAKLVISVILCQRTQFRGKAFASQTKERSNTEGRAFKDWVLRKISGSNSRLEETAL